MKDAWILHAPHRHAAQAAVAHSHATGAACGLHVHPVPKIIQAQVRCCLAPAQQSRGLPPTLQYATWASSPRSLTCRHIIRREHPLMSGDAPHSGPAWSWLAGRHHSLTWQHICCLLIQTGRVPQAWGASWNCRFAGMACSTLCRGAMRPALNPRQDKTRSLHHSSQPG